MWGFAAKKHLIGLLAGTSALGVLPAGMTAIAAQKPADEAVFDAAAKTEAVTREIAASDVEIAPTNVVADLDVDPSSSNQDSHSGVTLNLAANGDEIGAPNTVAEHAGNELQGPTQDGKPLGNKRVSRTPVRHIDDPSTKPLLFGSFNPRFQTPSFSPEDDSETITLGEDDNLGFSGLLTFLAPEETNLSLGVGPVFQPDYYGSDDYEVEVDPQVYIKLKNFVFLDDEGADFALVGFSNFRFGPSIRVRGRRDQDDNPALQGLGDVGTTFEMGGFAATTFLDRFSVKAKVRHGIKTGHRGTIIDAYVTALLFRAGPVSVSASGETSWIGSNYADAYFSVTPEQSARSNGRLDVYDAKAGFRDIGFSVNGYINVFHRWSLNPYASYNVIYDKYANSPIIADFGNRSQITAGFHIMREFTF